MHLRPPDSSLTDYRERRSVFVKSLHGKTAKERLAALRKWLDHNSPYSPEEKLANLRRALREEGIL